jgi:hypothetical protein
MKHFTIENESNNIAVHGSAKEAEAVADSERFSSEAALAKLAANWPASRLVEIWNSLPGETPVRKFKDRATAVSRIWKVIQNLGQTSNTVAEPASTPETDSTEPTAAVTATTVAPQVPDVAPEAANSTKKATRAKKTPVAASTKEAGAAREGSKTSQVIAMLKREGGTTVEEIMTAMDWQKHTTRAMLSAGGPLTRKHGLIVITEKIADQRRYSIKA